MIDVEQVSACLVTRGDVEMSEILASLPFSDVVVWNNQEREDLGIYGRYAAIAEAKNDVIFTQDDDLIVTCIDQLLARYDGRLLINYPPPWDIPWVSRGALFPRDLPAEAFARYHAVYPLDRYFTHFACDGIFALLTDPVVVDYGSRDLPHGLADGRVSTSAGWYDDKRPEIQRRVSTISERTTMATKKTGPKKTSARKTAARKTSARATATANLSKGPGVPLAFVTELNKTPAAVEDPKPLPADKDITNPGTTLGVHPKNRDGITDPGTTLDS